VDDDVTGSSRLDISNLLNMAVRHRLGRITNSRMVVVSVLGTVCPVALRKKYPLLPGEQVR
jgi:hypothetical protein